MEDLGLDSERRKYDVRSYNADHEALRAMVVKRAGNPEAGDLVKNVRPFGRVKSLHVGRGRGVTLWDEENDVLWLMAFSETHATHEKRDVYNYVAGLDGRDELLPTDADYEALFEAYAVGLLEGLEGQAAGIYEEARSSPGASVHRSYEEGRILMLVDLLVIDGEQCEEGWLCMTFPWESMPSILEVVDLAGRLLPDVIDIESLKLCSDFNGEELDANQLGFTWTVVPD